jgi:hypothetical protein
VAKFPLAGLYVVRCSADDTLLTNSLDITVNAGPIPTDGTDSSRVLWLKLDENSGNTAFDSSGNLNNGTVSGSATWQPTGGVRNGAMQFDGVSGLITVPDSPQLDNTSAFTLTYWFKADAYPGDSAGLVCKRNSISVDNAYTTYLKAADKHIYVDIDTSNNRFASTALIQTGLWYHVALVFDGTLPSTQRAKLWINGALDTTATETSATIPDYASSMMIGNTHPGAVNWFTGSIDDVRFYRRALSQTEILSLSTINFGPSVIAGPASPATNHVTSNVTGSVVDDGKGGAPAIRWSKVSGPGNVSFGNPNLVATTATFDRSGNYALRLSASDTQIETSQDLNIFVNPNTNVFEDWIAAYFPGVTNANIVGANSDPDADRAANLLEFALGMNPTNFEGPPFAPGQPGPPTAKIQNVNGTNYLVLTVQRPIGRLGINYIGECSPDLFNWSPGLFVGPPINTGDGTETAAFRDLVPVGEAADRFMRLRVQPQ